MRNQGIGSWPARRRRMTPDRAALVGDEIELTYRELDERCCRLANGLAELGVARGDRVAYLGKNDPTLLETLFATTSLGAMFVPLNWRLTAGELAYIVADCGAEVVVHSAEFTAPAALVQTDTATRLHHVLEVDSTYRALITGAPDDAVDHPVAMDDPAMIIYTSGTTGRPKGATLSHANVTWNCVNVLIDTELAADEVALVCAPLFHVAALNMITLPTIMKGGTVRLLPQFDPDQALDQIAHHGVTVMFGVPAMFNAMAQSAAWAGTDLSGLRRALCGGAPVPLATIRTYLDRGVAFLQGYGMTETSPGALFLAADRAADKAGSAGVSSFFTDVRVVRPDGSDVAPGEKGEVIVSGPNVMLGYWGLPEATREVMTNEWFHSGDVAVVDADGFATIVDRLKDVIISGGENIYPAEVESAFYTHPAVADCAVIGVPDTTWGEVGRAIVVLREEADARPTELLDHVRGLLAGYKVPKSVVFAGALPRNGAGKLLKNVLRDAYGTAPAELDAFDRSNADSLGGIR